jgi:cation transporter-like permease
MDKSYLNKIFNICVLAFLIALVGEIIAVIFNVIILTKIFLAILVTAMIGIVMYWIFYYLYRGK